MARPCTICEHPRRDEIDRSLVDSAGSAKRFRRIAETFGVNERSIRRHGETHLTEGLKRSIVKHGHLVQETSQLDVVASLGRLIERAEMMLTAADEWLRDPADPSRYNLNPRTHEIKVVYEEEDGGRMVRKTAKLSHLMERLEKNLPITIIKGESRTADPRKLLLDAVATLKPVLELLGKASGQLASDAAVNVFFEGPEWRRITDTLVAAIAPFPGAAEAAAGALAAMNGDAVE